MALVSTRVQVEQVTSLVNVHKRNYVRPPGRADRGHVRDHLMTEKFLRFRFRHPPFRTKHCPAQIRWLNISVCALHRSILTRIVVPSNGSLDVRSEERSKRRGPINLATPLIGAVPGSQTSRGV